MPIAVLCSGTTYILGPLADVAAFWGIVGGGVGFVLGDAGATGA